MANNSRPKNEGNIGYGRPPVATRFKKGQSGNPAGRPKGSRSVEAIFTRVLEEKVPVTTTDGRQKRISKIEAVVTQLVNKAARGDIRSQHLLFKHLGLRNEENRQAETASTQEGIFTQENMSRLTDEDVETLAKICLKLMGPEDRTET